MRNLLIVVALLLSSIALAEDTTLALTGLTIEKDQVIIVELRGDEHFYIQMMRSPVDLREDDELEIVFKDVMSGEYEMRISVRENDKVKRSNGEFDIGQIIKQQSINVTIE